MADDGVKGLTRTDLKKKKKGGKKRTERKNEGYKELRVPDQKQQFPRRELQVKNVRERSSQEVNHQKGGKKGR